MMETFSTKLTSYEGNLWSFYFIVPEKISDYFIKEKKTKRVIFIIDNEEYHGALMADGNGQYFINTNKTMRKKHHMEIGKPFEVTLKENDSKYGIYLPPEMEELLKLDDEGNKYFHTLTPGKQRSLLHIVGKIKSTEIRIKKSMVILEYLKDNNGTLDFKELNNVFKQANQR